MDPSKKDTLIQWLKEINSSFLIESLHNMKEGEQSTVLLNKMKATPYDLNTKKECFEIIKKFIEDKYDQSHVEQVNFDKDDEVDLAKIAILMLRVGLEGEHQEDFIKAALSLNEQSQLEVMSILKGILNGASADLQLDKLLINKSLETFDSENSSENSSQENATEQSPSASGSEELLHDASSNSNSGSGNISRSQEKISLLTSINMENEEIEQKNMLLRKLNGNLKLERHLRSEMEYDLEEKNKTILLKDDKIQELNNQIKELKKLQNKLDDYNNLMDQYDKLTAVADKMKSQSDELRSLKLQNSSLINENAKVYEELDEMKKMKMQLEVAQLNRDKYLEELQSEERKCFSLQLNLDYKQKVLDETTHNKKILEENLVKMTEKYETLKISYEEETFAFWSEKQPTGESMNVITDLIMTELKAELENIKATWIAPDIYKQLKMDLSKVTSERDIFKSQCLELQEESVSLKLNKDLFQNEVEKENSEHDNAQHQILDKQLTIEILKEDLESICVRDSNWQQIEAIYKSEQQHQMKVTSVKSSIQNFAQKIVHATKTNISTENTEFKKVKLLLEENAAIKKELAKQFKELTGEKQDVFEKLELETTDSKELVTVLKPKLETASQNSIEQKSKLKGDFEELTKVHTLSLEERYLETFNEVEQISVQHCEKDKRIYELTKSLSEKSSLVEKYLNSNNELTQIITSLKENVSEKEIETNLLKKELEEKSSTISEKDAKLEELTSLVGEMQQTVSEISQEHVSEIMTIEEKYKNFKDVQVDLSQKEEELAKQAEYYSVAAASDKVYGQYEASIKTYQKPVSNLCNKVESQNRQIKYLHEEISDLKVKAKQEYNEMKRKLSQHLSEKDEEMKASKQEMAKIQNAYEDEITKCKSLEEQINRLKENPLSEENVSVITDHLITELKSELGNIKPTWIDPDIHKQLKIGPSKPTSEQDILESKSLKLWEESLNLKPNNDLILQKDLESICVTESNWQQTEAKYKSELQQNQGRVAQVKYSLQDILDKIIHAVEASILTENMNLPTKENSVASFLPQKLCHCVEETSNDCECLQIQVSSQSAHLEEINENLSSLLKNWFKDIVLEYKKLQDTLVEQEKALESYAIAKQSLEETKAALEKQLDCITVLKSQLEENAANKKELTKLPEELAREKQNILEKLELEIADSKELVTTFKPKLNQNVIEQESKLKGDFEELTKVHTLSLEERYLETFKEVEQIGVQLGEKDKRICELTKSLSEKSSLVEIYLNSNNELTQIVTSMKENVSEKEIETNLLKKELEEKSGTISEKDAKLDELTSLVGEMQQKVSEISQKHFSEMMTMEEKYKNFKDLQAKLSRKEEELAKQQAEYYSVAAASDKVYGQYEASVKTYQNLVSKLCDKVDNQDKQIVCLLEQMSDMKLKAEQEYNKMKKELTEDNEEVKVSKQELIKIQRACEEAIVKSKSLKEHQNMLEEKQPTGYSISVVTDNLMTELKRELDNIKTTWIAPDIHEQLKADFSKLTCEQDILESKWLKLHDDFLSLKSSNDLLKNEMEKMKIEYNNAQYQILDKQQTIEIMKKDIERKSPVKSSIQNFAEKIVHATKTKISAENSEFERVKLQLEENAAIKKGLEKQFKELTGEKQDVLEKLELETADSKEFVTDLKPKLETVNQNTIEQESKLKSNFEELTKVHTLLLKERYLETLKEVEQIGVQLCEKDKRICELTKSLSVKSSLVEKYLNSNNELTQVVTSLKENVSEKETETNLLKKELEEKSGTISEKDAKLDELTSLVGEMQQKVSEISQKHVSEIEKLQENLKVEYEEKISSITSEYVNKITSNYMCKSLMEIKEKEHSKELETTKEMLHQEYNQKSCCLIEEYEKKLKSVSEDFEKKLSSDYVAVGEINEQNKKHIQEVIQMKEKLEEYEGKIKSQDEEHKEALQKVMVEFQENISKNYISKEVFEAKLKDETIKYTQLEQKFVEEEKLQIVLKEHDEKLAQVTLNYEEKIATDFVPRQTFECEQEKHVTALLEQQTFYKRKLELLDEEHKIFINNKVIEFEDNIATNYVMRSDFDNVQARLSQKEKEFSKLQAEFDLDVTASDNVNEQYETSVKTYEKKVTEICNKVESQNRQIECLQEQIAEMTVKAEQEYTEMKRELSQDLSDKDEEMKTSRQEMIKIQSAYEDEITKCKSLEEQINRLKGNHNNVITSLKESFQSEIKHMKETFQKEFYRRETIYKTDLKKLNDSHFQELTLSQTKWKKLNETQCANISNYEKIVSEKELQAANIKQQLLSEMEARAELEKYLVSSKENHEEEIKKLNSIINEVREEYQQLKKKNSGTEAYFQSREQKLIIDHTKTLSKVEEMNASLADCLQISQKELEIFKKKHENIFAEINHLKKQLKTTKQERLNIIGKLQDYRVFYVLFTAMLCSFLVVPIYS
ncbi:golgin subfamily B member 1 [Octopus bimaculoides]|uniref:HOOK N-terminal domain-containing protein n=1 Tax=Octopus bimaculoides TaxID=37653 RepID=A0A0L8IEJ2_OCTBM|nr:golgin subfamily B member 1 [Octopus bimaculoides]XP_014772247.1 golgin subfamily B member 1 [Octopus bimaculoides]|eukprot:XP_014772238.1 PREDICTED: golgin subfamily B member 1-like isoform X1 [Octopus bimaculoides]